MKDTSYSFMRASIALLLATFVAGGALAQEQRALLIGINTYVPEGASEEVRGRAFSNLSGTHNDVAAMKSLLTSRFSFEEEQVQVLQDAEATRQGILDALDDLVAQSESGGLSTVVFYYSGHGSQVLNTESPESDGMDETLVPADAYAGAGEVRDKEVRRRFNALLENGVELTAIYDNCHSGSASRGVGDIGASRKMEPSPATVADPPPYGRIPSSFPSALVISAAGEDQLAREFTTEDGIVAGIFTHTLVEILRSASAELPARLVFQQLVARVKSLGFDQDPQLEAGALRYDSPFFGASSTKAGTAASGTVVAVQKSSDGALTLQGGLALGIREGTVLRRLSGEDAGDVRLRVTAARGPVLSDVEVTEGSRDDIASGDLFTVEQWVADPAAPLSVYLPPALDTQRTSPVVEAVSALEGRADFEWTANPIRTRPTHVVAWTGETWELQQQGKTVADLGATPTADALGQALGSDPVALFLHLPASPEHDAALRTAVQELGTPIRFADSAAEADYFLSGYPEGDLAWFYRRATASGEAGAMPTAPQVVPSSLGADLAAGYLAQQALRLSALWGWLHLEAPGGGAAFPYHLDSFVSARTGEDLAPGDTLQWGEGYRVRLVAEPGHLRRQRALASLDPAVPKEWSYYLFAIDCTGSSVLLHGAYNEAKVDLLGAEVPPDTLVLGGSGGLFTSGRACASQPAEADQFFLLATSDPLPDPSVLRWSGVGTNEKSRAASSAVSSPLGSLLAGMRDGQRGTRQPTPSGWWVGAVTVPSSSGPQ